MLIDIDFKESNIKHVHKGLYLSRSHLIPHSFEQNGWEGCFLLYPEFRLSSVYERMRALQKMYKDNLYFSTYGSCDSISQFLTTETYRIIDKSPFHLVVVFEHLKRADYPEYRWHKNGSYLGTHTPKYEHLGDEDIDGIYQFHVYRKIISTG